MAMPTFHEISALKFGKNPGKFGIPLPSVRLGRNVLRRRVTKNAKYPNTEKRNREGTRIAFRATLPQKKRPQAKKTATKSRSHEGMKFLFVL